MMGCFVKIINGWILVTVFTKGSVLDVWLGSEYVSNYAGFFSIIFNWGYHFEFSKKFSNLISISIYRVYKYIVYISISSKNFFFFCNSFLFETCWNLTSGQVAASLLLTWNMATCISTASTSDNNDQANTIGRTYTHWPVLDWTR